MSQRSLSSAATSIVTQPPWKAVRPPPRPLPRPPRAAALALGPSVSAPPAIQVAPDAPNLHLPPRPRTPPPPYTFLTADDDGFDEEEEEEYDLAQFLGLSLLSHAAVQLRDKVPRDTHVKHGIPYPRCFTGKDIVTTLHSQIEWDLENRGISMNDRGPALQVARSLQSQLFFYDVEWGGRILEDRMEDVYALLDDEGEADSELPTAVVTMLTRCYSPSCGEDVPCYAYSCPNKGVFQMLGLSEALQMNAVDTIVSNHDQRGALLTQGLPPSDLRTALRLCYQHISAALLSVLDSREAKQAVLLLEGDRAQSFLDAVQDVLDKGSLPSAQHTSQARRLILRLSEARDQLPSSLFITDVADYDEHPTFCGGFGDIYRASHKGSTVAVKRIRMVNTGADSKRSRLQFCREALVWQTLQHRYVLPLIGIDRQSFMSSFCLVSPWMKHGTVLKYLSEHGRQDVDKLLLQVAEGLEYLHSMNIVHGDLRGTNILVDDDSNACLADFGLTTIADAASTTTAALTSTSHHAGSARWFAPELIQPTAFGCDKFQRTPASDVYAFACVCLELHTGRPPFSGVSPDIAAMLKVIAGERPARPAASMSDGWWGLVSVAWAQNFRDRPDIKTIIQSMRKLNG